MPSLASTLNSTLTVVSFNLDFSNAHPTKKKLDLKLIVKLSLIAKLSFNFNLVESLILSCSSHPTPPTHESLFRPNLTFYLTWLNQFLMFNYFLFIYSYLFLLSILYLLFVVLLVNEIIAQVEDTQTSLCMELLHN